MALHGLTPQHGPQNEMRRDKPGSRAAWLYWIYLDNYDSLQKMDALTAARVEGQPFPWKP